MSVKVIEICDLKEDTKMNIAVFASHGGSDLQAIIDGCNSNQINARVAVVISNNEDSMALQRAKKENIPSYHLSVKKVGSEEILAQEIIEVLSKYDIEMIFLAGYMRMLHVSILEKYNNRIFNIHPALLPKFGGKGMYGMNVHNAVIEAGEKETGVTIHRVNAEYDSGEIVAQTKVPVQENDTPESLAARVLNREHEFLVEVISDIVDGKIHLGQNNPCRYYEWDEDSFVLPSEYILNEKSELADALKVFYEVGGLDFFNVEEPDCYASKWLEFLGELYAAIMDGEYIAVEKQCIIPLSEMEKKELAERGVPEIFLTNIGD